MKKFNEHTFAICAYGESQYLEECIQSVLNQSIQSNVIVATSTPNQLIEGLCSKYKLPLFINTGEHGITQDWNFAISQCKSPIVTVAHQDDVYYGDYTKTLYKKAKKAEKPIMYFCDYYEVRNGQRVHDNRNLKIKRFMLLPMRTKLGQKSRWIRRRILSLGSPICCPSAAFFLDNIEEHPVFKNHFRADEDWEAWEKLSNYKGEFLYETSPQVGHRIHQESETSAILGDNARSVEDYEMYRKFWPKGIAKILCALYKNSEKSNDL